MPAILQNRRVTEAVLLQDTLNLHATGLSENSENQAGYQDNAVELCMLATLIFACLQP